MHPDPAQIVDVAARSVGACGVVADLSWDHGESVVVELETSTGERLIGKAHRQAVKFTSEHTAYQRWVPSLGRRAPRLVAADPATRVLILTKLNASAIPTTPDVDLSDVHRQAGALLAQFHGSAPAVPIAGYAQTQRDRFAHWVARAEPNLLSTGDVAFVEHQLAALDTLEDPLGVPCHRDWHPRNWLIDHHGVIHAIDFEHARVAPWHEDLHRLWWKEWLETPALADRFLAGYGHTLNDDDRRWLQATSTLGHLTTIVWAHEHHDDAFAAHGRQSLDLAKQHPGGRRLP